MAKGDMKRIRQRYGVPAKRGGRVRLYYPRGNRWVEDGIYTITSAGSHLVALDAWGRRCSLHPTWGLVYLKDDGSVLKDVRGEPR